jgi:hypothetical protein
LEIVEGESSSQLKSENNELKRKLYNFQTIIKNLKETNDKKEKDREIEREREKVEKLQREKEKKREEERKMETEREKARELERQEEVNKYISLLREENKHISFKPNKQEGEEQNQIQIEENKTDEKKKLLSKEKELEEFNYITKIAVLEKKLE